MDTTGTSGNFNLHDLFKSSTQPGFNEPGTISAMMGSASDSGSNQGSATASCSNPFNHYPSNAMSSLESYDNASSSGSPGFPPQTLTNQQYTPYHLDQALWPHYQSHGLSQPPTTRPPSPSIPPSLPLLHATNVSRPTSSSMDSAHLMTLLNFQTMSSPPISNASPEVSSSNVVTIAVPSAPPMNLDPNSGSGRNTRNNLPKGRHLKGEHIVYDIDNRLPGESQPQLEVSPITMYASDPPLVGRQIAVNRSYICYGLRANRHIRILNIHTASRGLLRGHSERVTDMVFFAEDVHLLASASSDGRVFVRKIVECPVEDSKSQITEQIILALQFMGSWESVHPRVCWLNHTQDVLIVGVSKFVFIVDIPKVRQNASPDGFTTGNLVFCHVNNPVEGFLCVAHHDGDITCLSSIQWPMLASASKDGTIRIWKDQNMSSVSVLKPHQEQEVGAVAFLSASHNPNHIVLLSAGRLNQELKLWIPATKDGWFPQSGPIHWKCIQTLQFKSSTEVKPEDAFFNQVLVVPKAHVIVLANAKRSALYVLHVDFGHNPTCTRLDYLAEFSVLYPVFSFTATCENAYDGHGIVQVYCIQTLSIQQYSLDLSQCLPPIEELHESLPEGLIPNTSTSAVSPMMAYDVSSILQHAQAPGVSLNDKSSEDRNVAMVEASESTTNDDTKGTIKTLRRITEFPGKDSASHVADGVKSSSSASSPSPRGSPLNRERPVTPNEDGTATHVPVAMVKTGHLYAHDESQQSGEKKTGVSIPSSPNKAIINHLPLSSSSLFTDMSSNELTIPELQNSTGLSSHLVTPSELMSMVAMSRAEVEGPAMPYPPNNVISKEMIKPNENFEKLARVRSEAFIVETKEMTESTTFHEETTAVSAQSHGIVLDSENMEVCNTRYESLGNVFGEYGILDQPMIDDTQFQGDDDQPLEQRESFPRSGEGETSASNVESAPIVPVVLPARKKKNKNKTVTNMPTSMGFSSSTPTSTLFSSIASTSEQDSNNLAVCSTVGVSEQLTVMQDSLTQLTVMQKELQKQMATMLTISIAKEVKRVEVALGQRMEKVLKAHMDAMWARLQEVNAKLEKIERDRVQQLSSFLSNSINKDLPMLVERAVKKEFAAVGPSVARIVAPSIDKGISTAVSEAFQKGINEKGIMQLEESLSTKLEASLTRQLQTQFQVSGKPALQKTLSSCLEGSIIPAFERACKTMFGQVDVAFQKGLSDQAHAQHQLAASNVSLVSTLQDAVASITSVAASLKDEFADGQRRLLAIMENTGVSRGPYIMNGNLPDKAVTVQHVEESLDPTKELARLIAERKLEEAFNKALALTNVGIVSWLCNQVELVTLLTTTPPPLSQGVLLALVQQLGCDLGNDTEKKLIWIKDAALALNPHEPGLPPHVVRHFLEQLYTNLHALLVSSNMTADLVHATRLVIHVVNSLLTAYK